jgi:phage shock protein E
MKKIVFALFLSLSLFAAEFITGADAKRMVKEGALLLDVRTLVEYKIKNIPGSRRMHYEDIPSRSKEIEKMTGGNKGKQIVVFCQSGGRSSRAKEMLEKAGYKNVHNLGGISRWFESKE